MSFCKYLFCRRYALCDAIFSLGVKAALFSFFFFCVWTFLPLFETIFSSYREKKEAPMGETLRGCFLKRREIYLITMRFLYCIYSFFFFFGGCHAYRAVRITHQIKFPNSLKNKTKKNDIYAPQSDFYARKKRAF